jgi:hypothetical protein
MNYFLILIIIALGAGGYYEYTTIQDLDSANKQKFDDLSAKIDALQAENKKIEDQLKSGASPLTPAPSTPTTATAPATPAASAAPKPGPPPASNILGNIATSDGKTYLSCRLLKVEADGIVINHSEGIIKLAYALLSPDLQRRFGYDMKQSLTLPPDQVQIDEQQRQAAGD